MRYMAQPVKIPSNWIDLENKKIVKIENEKMVTSEMIKQTEEQSSFKDNRAPKCARCRNHGVVNSLKGHKHFCKWKNCSCPRCQVVVERQKITAERVAFLRYQRKMKSKKGFDGTEFVSTPNKYVDLGGMKYLDDISKRETEYGLNDSDSERNSSGTPASISPPASPNALSVTSSEMESKKSTSQRVGMFCTDPTCTECWNNSPYMFNTKLDRLRSSFPMLTMRTLEDTLTRFNGNFQSARSHLIKSLRSNAEIDNKRGLVCRDPNCRECKLSIYKRTSPKLSEELISQLSYPESRKRPQSYSPTSYEIPAKRVSPVNFSSFSSLRKSPEITRSSPPVIELYTPLTKVNTRPEGKSKIIAPPSLLKQCVDCSCTISADDKFCGKCGYKQN